MSPSDATGVQRVAALGAGLIGRSWTALFLAAGKEVTVYDPDPAAGNPPSPKPVYSALKVLLATVGERWPLRPDQDAASLQAASGVIAVTFEGTDPGPVFAAWRPEGQGTWAAPADGELVAEDGASLGSVQKGDPVPVGSAPVYLR